MNSTDKAKNRTLTVRTIGSSVAGALLLALMTTAWAQTLEQQSSTQTNSELKASEIVEDGKNTQTDNTAEAASTTKPDHDTNKESDDKDNRDPIGAGTDERFIPTEEISEDLPVSFPVDI